MKAILEFDLSPGSDDHYNWAKHNSVDGLLEVYTNLKSLRRTLYKGHNGEDIPFEEVLNKLDEVLYTREDYINSEL